MHPSLGLDPDPRHFFLDEEEAVSAVVLLAWPEEARADPRAAAESARAALRRWVAMGLPVRDGAGSGGCLRFDIAHVVNFMRAAGLDGRDPVFPARTVPVFRRLTADAMGFLPGGPPLLVRQFRIQLRREFNLARLRGRGPVRLRVPLPYDDPTQRLLHLSLDGFPAGATARRTANSLQVVLPPADRGTTAAVEASLHLAACRVEGGFEDPGPGSAATGGGGPVGSGPDPYLNPSEHLIQVTPSVRRLAAALAPADAASASARVRSMLGAFWDFFHGGTLRLGYIRHGELDPLDPLAHMVRRGWFDCLGGACLLVALCRARGVPARLVHGLVLHEPAPTYLFWAEVRAEDGWIPIDLASWDHAEGKLGVQPWSRLFLGRLEPRMKLQCFPKQVTGPAGVGVPAAWSVVRTPAPGGGVSTSVYDAATAALAYRDTVRVARLG